ncbi:MAG: hypothetical protein ACTSPQ_04275, partial [Candidatus Helarchaeota archaeon]
MENLIRKIKDLIDNIRASLSENEIHEYNVDTNLKELFDKLPKDLILDNDVPLVLSEDVYLELGSPQVPSCKLLVPVNNPDFINNGKITILGSEVSQKFPVKTVLPFSQIIFIYTDREMDPDLYRKMQIHLSVFNIIRGFMIRAIPRKFWIRISKEAINLGFNLK